MDRAPIAKSVELAYGAVVMNRLRPHLGGNRFSVPLACSGKLPGDRFKLMTDLSEITLHAAEIRPTFEHGTFGLSVESEHVPFEQKPPF